MHPFGKRGYPVTQLRYGLVAAIFLIVSQPLGKFRQKKRTQTGKLRFEFFNITIKFYRF